MKSRVLTELTKFAHMRDTQQLLFLKPMPDRFKPKRSNKEGKNQRQELPLWPFENETI